MFIRVTFYDTDNLYVRVYKYVHTSLQLSSVFFFNKLTF